MDESVSGTKIIVVGEANGSGDMSLEVKSSDLVKRRPCKPQGPEYEYFDILSARENGKGWRIRCKFCGSREMNSHAPRMRKHLVSKCEGNVPEEVKHKFRNHRPVYTHPTKEEGVRKSIRKRTILEYEGGTDEDEEDNFLDTSNMSHSQRVKAMEQVAGIILKQPKSEETSFSKKPLKQMTKEDFDRERLELETKKMRTEIKVLEDQSRFWARMSTGVDKILKAVDLYIDSRTRAMDDIGQVHTLYTNHDGSAVLSAAYAEHIPNST